MGLVADIFCKLLPRFIVTCLCVCVCVCVYVCTCVLTQCFGGGNLRPAGILSMSGLLAILLTSQTQSNALNSTDES